MELRDFAERVLFATTMDEKLVAPEAITDERPGPSRPVPEMPGRPPGLGFTPRASSQVGLASPRRLEDERERGKLLHFFANHELLAAELMALAVLRFPEAPAEFRRDIFRTLRDEQTHLKLYLQRMHECGTEFGELPVNGFFWRCLSTMKSPMDYVAGLSLTLEQANLDYCRQFACEFEAAGDGATPGVLERIYRDEIRHVSCGLKWFRLWKEPRLSDWEAFRGQLKLPLSPRRAKGGTIDWEGRRAAGLDAEFMAELDVYSQSRGRTPDVFVFNPFAEGHIAAGKGFSPTSHQAQLARDLANLPQFLCGSDDVVLVERRPAIGFLQSIKQAGLPLPEFVEIPGGRLPSDCRLGQRKIGRLRPWAWGPESVELLAPLFPQLTAGQAGRGLFYNENIGRLYSKAWSAAFLRNILSGSTDSANLGDSGARGWSGESWVCREEEAGVAAETMTEALAAIEAIRRRGHHKVVVKEAHGLAGQNSIRLWEPELLETQRQWMLHRLEQGRQMVVEPWLERVLDFSVQLEMKGGGLKVEGYTGLINDLRGQFQANWATAGFARHAPSQVVKALNGPRDIFVRFHLLYEEIMARLEPELRKAGYVGPVGIDAFIYRTPEGIHRLKPVVEMNPRYTMGRLTVELMKRTCPGRQGVLRLLTRKMVAGEGFKDFAAYANHLAESHPVRLQGTPAAQILEGAVCLNDPGTAQTCLAVFEVGRSLDPTIPK